MRSLAALSLAAFALFSPCHLRAGVPPNDKITNAIALDANLTLNRYKGGDITDVTSDHLLLLFPGNTYPVDYGLKDVWFKWTAPVSGTLAIQALALNSWVWGITVPGPAVQDSYTVIAYDSLSTSNNAISATTSYNFKVEAGKTYFNGLAFSPFGSPVTYTYVQSFIQDALSDSFATSTQLGGTDFTITGNNTSATKETNEPDHSASPALSSDKSLWCVWTSPDTRRAVTLQATSRAFVPIIAVYSGDALDNLTLVTRSSSSTGSNGSVATANFVAEDGVSYHFAFDGSNGKSGPFSLKFTATTAKPGFFTQPVATTIEQNTTAVFTTSAAYTGDTVTYQWQRLPAGSKTWVNLSDDGTFLGSQTATLSVLATLDMNNDLYRVQATDIVGTSNSRAVALTVTEFPAVSTEVLGTVATTIANGTVPRPSNGGVYFATGLPKGLTLNTETGAITGVIDAKPGTYRVTYGSTNGKKKNPTTFILQIIVAPLSTHFAGTFEALIGSPDSQSIPEGKLTLKVAANGTYTGTYFDLGIGSAYSYRGKLSLDQSSRVAGTVINQPVTISRGSKGPLLLDFGIAEPPLDSIGGNPVLSATVSNPNHTVIGNASDGAPVSRFSATNLAAWAGQYTVRLTNGMLISSSISSNPEIPKGSGYATGVIADKTGVLALRGYLADNTPFTSSLASSTSGTYRLAQKIYGVGGSLAGRINLVERSTSNLSTLSYHATALSGSSLYWAKPLRPKDKLYPAGFDGGFVLSSLLMEPWTNPSGDIAAGLGLAAAGDMKIQIDAVVPQDGNGSLAYGLPVDVRLTGTGNLSFVDPSTNATKFALKVNMANGTFTGTYELAEPNAPANAKPRKVTYSGVLFQSPDTLEGDVIGEGFAIVPPLLATEKMTAASIKFLAGPPASPFGLEQQF